MKRSFPINLAGHVFYIDEDAYSMLDNYLSNLTITFGAEDDREIVIDIENRIAEILLERPGCSTDANRPITIDDVSHVIDVIGSPEQMADADDTLAGEKEPAQPTPPPFQSKQSQPRRRLYRDPYDCVLGGVVSGLCKYCGWTTTPARVVLVVAAFCFPVLVVAYMVAWILIPEANTAEERLAMDGSEVNINNIGRTVKDGYMQYSAPQKRRDITVSDVVSLIAKIGLALIALIALPIAFGTMIAAIVAIVALVAGLFMSPVSLAQVCDNLDVAVGCYCSEMSQVLVWCLVAFIPAALLVWSACCVFFKTRPLSRGLAVTLIVMEIVLIVLGIILSTLL